MRISPWEVYDIASRGSALHDGAFKVLPRSTTVALALLRLGRS
jgi:hypothetical protein